MAIVLSSSQTAVAAASTPQLQQWSFSPGSISIDYYQGSALPAPVTINTTFRDIAGTALAQNYTELTYRCYLLNDAANYIVLSGPLHTGMATFAAYGNGLQGEMLYTFQNLNVLTPDTYAFTAYHEIWGKSNAGVNTLIDSRNIKINLRVFPSTVPQLSVNEFNFVWTIGSTNTVNAPAFTIDAANWSLRSPKGFFFMPATGAVIEQPTASGGALVTGSGSVSLIMGMVPPFVEPGIITENPVTLYLEVNGGVLEIPIHVTYLQSSGLFISDGALEFISYKGIQNAPSQQVSVYFGSAYNISCPPWMMVSPAAGNGSSTLNFIPVSADNMDAGTYTGSATVTLASSGEVLGTILLSYQVVDSVVSPYDSNEYAFTLDRLFYNFVSLLPDAYFDVQLSVKAYEFYSASFKTEVLNFKIALFQGRQTLNIGRSVDRVMELINDLAIHNSSAYKPAEAMLQVTERSGTFSQVYNLPTIKFIAGLKPRLAGGSGFLDINAGARRVTPASWQIVNILAVNHPTISLFKNGIELNSFTPFRPIYAYKLDFAQLGAAQGDVFEVRLTSSHIVPGTVSKLFKVFPEGYNSNVIVWENEYKLRSVLECTGKFQVNSELANRTQELELELRPVLEKLESTKTAKLTINTGWLLKSDMPSVESLMRSNRAILMLGDRNIKLVPVSEKITNVDDDMATMQYDLEFQINREYNEEIYSF